MQYVYIQLLEVDLQPLTEAGVHGAAGLSVQSLAVSEVISAVFEFVTILHQPIMENLATLTTRKQLIAHSRPVV